MSSDSTHPTAELQRLLTQAQSGCELSQARLLDVCRPYLLMVANGELDAKLRGKIGASDIVQETLIQAQQALGDFAGENERQLLAWLRKILLHELADVRRHFVEARKRAIGLEQPYGRDSVVSQKSARVREQQTPSSHLTAKEEAEALSAALQRLSDDDRQVIRLRSWERLAWDEVAKHLDRTPDAARKLWSRAVERLKQEMEK